jgi:endonuclease/exonuclease/phosphatase family metal-dependent hydrolase
MKIASFNIENIFQRHTWLISAYRKSRLEDWEAELNTLMARELKTPQDTERIEELLGFLKFDKQADRPRLELKHFSTGFGIRFNDSGYLPKASRLTGWEGWMRLATQPISERAIFHKAKVIADVNPDILLLQEVEGRNTLTEFHQRFLKNEFRLHYEELHFSPTNDLFDRGMALLLKPGYRLNTVRPHLNEKDKNGKLIFDFDVVEYVIDTTVGGELLCFHAHFSEGDSLKIAAQAQYLAELYHKRSMVFKNIVILGCLQLPSYSKELSPLFKQLSLKRISQHNAFSVMPDEGSDATYYRLGGYAKGVNIKQQDYLVLPPTLFQHIKSCGLNRQAMWPEKQPQWQLYSTVKKQSQAASGHPLLWVGLI